MLSFMMRKISWLTCALTIDGEIHVVHPYMVSLIVHIAVSK